MIKQSAESGGSLRIAHLTTVDMSLALLLATELQVDREAGHEVLGISAPGKYVERVEALGVQHVPIASLTRQWNVGKDLKAFVELIRELRRLKLDVLHTHNPKTGVMGRIAGRLTGVPVVVNTCHGLWARPQDSWRKRAFVIGLEAIAARFSDFELFQNAQDARALRRFLKTDRWRVVGNGVDLTRFVADPEGRARVRGELGVADDEILVGTIGRRVREKGLAEYAEAAAALGDRATFIWVGPQDDTDTAATVPHEEAITFVSERTDMPAVYSALDIFVLASYREGFSRASMEAAACGKPMVLSDIRGCREIGTHEEHLLLAPAHNAPALTAAIERLLGDPGLRARLGNAARERAHQGFDQRAIAKASLETYAQVRDGKGLRPAEHKTQPAGRIRVLHVLPHDQNRGAQVYAGQLRDALRGDPEQEHLLVTLFEGRPGAARPDYSLNISSSPARRIVDPRAIRSLRRLIQGQAFDVVVAHGGESLKYAIPAAGRAPVVYYKVGLSTTEISRRGRRCLYANLAHRAARVVAVSHDIAVQVEALFSVPRDRLGVIPNARDPRTYYPNSTQETPATPTLLWVGQLEPGKRPELFIEAVGLLRRRGLAFEALMVGDGPLRKRIEAPAAAAGVCLLGRRDDVAELMRKASALVMTSASNTEGMPGVLIEAALSGLPTVTTAAAGVRDIVLDERTGLVADDHPDSVVKAVARLLTDETRRRVMGTAAHEHGITHFSVAATAAQWRDLVASAGRSRKVTTGVND